MEVTFYGTYDKQMFLEALRLTEKRSVLSSIFRYLALGLAIFIVGGTIYAWIAEGMDQSDVGRLARNLITGLLFGYYFFSGIITRNRSIANLFRLGPERVVSGTVNLEGIIIGTKENQVLLEWNRFAGKGENGKLFALRTVDGSVAVFHRDFFATESDWQRFRQFANQKVIEPK